MRVRQLAAPIGAEIHDVDLAESLDDCRFSEIVDLFHKHAVIVFRNQNLTADQQIAFSRRFGDLDVNVRSEFNKDGRPEVLVLSNIFGDDGKPIGVQDAGRYWHTDLCYLTRPARATVIFAIEVPTKDNEPVGDTLFSSMVAAYEALPPSMKARIEGLKAVHSYRYTYDKKAKEFGLRPSSEVRGTDWMPPDVIHSVVRVHPVTGQKCLYVNEGYTTRIVGLLEDESDTLIAELTAHCVQPEFVYRNKWRVGDVLMWDNCLTQHKAVNDYKLPQRRLLERTTVLGPERVGVLA